MSNSRQSVSAPVSPNNQESVSEPNSPLSEFQPMEEVSVGLAPGVPEDLKETAQANLINLKNQYSIVYGHYLSYHKVQPDSDNARNAFAICKEAEKQYLEAKNAFAILKSIHEPVKMQDEKKFSLVPSSLPFLQLKTDIVIHKKNHDTVGGKIVRMFGISDHTSGKSNDTNYIIE
ncbi:hypothetical protein BDF21DRAFT_460152 [Thamnidium elegans]|nr:hypothetical protein BDF21DRAFT_460152 [Thamnidium elegans]